MDFLEQSLSDKEKLKLLSVQYFYLPPTLCLKTKVFLKYRLLLNYSLKAFRSAMKVKDFSALKSYYIGLTLGVEKLGCKRISTRMIFFVSRNSVSFHQGKLHIKEK